MQRFSSPSRIKQQLELSLDELAEKEFICEWELVKTTDETDYKLCLEAGPAFISAADARTRDNTARLLSPQQNQVLAALAARGVREDRARQILLDLPDNQPVMDQLEWGDAEIARKQRTREPIGNPPGFYVYLLRSNYPVPADFETTRKRALREQAQQRQMDARARQAQAELDKYEQRERYDAWVAGETDSHLREKAPAPAVERRLREHMKRIQQDAPQYRWAETTLREFAWRKLREEVAAELELPSFDEFNDRRQSTLF